jgi:hypothetical protein
MHYKDNYKIVKVSYFFKIQLASNSQVCHDTSMNVASRHLNTAIIVLACAFLFVVISLVAVFSGTVSPDNVIVSTPTLVQVAPTDSSQYQSV